MERDYLSIRVPELMDLLRRNGVRGYSKLRKGELIDLIRRTLVDQTRAPTNEPSSTSASVTNRKKVQVTDTNPTPGPSNYKKVQVIDMGPTPGPSRQTISNHKAKRDAQKRTKGKRESARLRSEIDELTSKRDEIKDKIKKLSRGAHVGFKKKKIRLLSKDVKKIEERVQELTNRLKKIESVLESIQKPQVSKENKALKRKIEDINRRIRRAKGKTKRNLMIKREKLKLQHTYQQLDMTPRLIEGAFGGNYSRYRIGGVEGMDLQTFLSRIRDSIITVLKKESASRAVREQTWIRFAKGDKLVNLAFNSRMTPVYYLNDIDSIVQSMINHMAQQVENPALRDSKFVFDRIMYTDISIHRLNLIRGSIYIPLPDWLAKKKAILNPKNLDMKCFKWAVVAGLKWEEIDRDHQQVSRLRRYENEFDWSGMRYPVSISDISKFETRSRIGVNVLTLNGRTIYICRKGIDYDRNVNLMILEDGDKKHYVMIKSLERLLSKMNCKHNPAQHFCNNCLQGFSDVTSRDNHYEYCRSNESVRIEMPTGNPIVSYSNGQHQFKVPFIMYADFESILEPIQGVSNNPNISSTRGINSHKPSGWCLHSKFLYGKLRNQQPNIEVQTVLRSFVKK